MRSILRALIVVLAASLLGGCTSSNRANPVMADAPALVTAPIADDGTVSTQTDRGGGPWPHCFTVIKGHYKCTQCFYKGGSSTTSCVPYHRP